MTYLITGGAGFIGSHLADALIARGDRVIVLDDLSTGAIENVAHLLGHGLRIERGTALDPALVSSLVAQADVVVHLAASVGVRLVLRHPLKSFINNVLGCVTVFRACAAIGRRVLFASSSEVYGKNAAGALWEEADGALGSTTKTRWSYGTAKAAGEVLARAYGVAHLPAIIVRLFNVAGPRQSGAHGSVIPSFVQQALRGDDVTVFGDGEQRRCFCHVDDTVAALIALLDHPNSVGQVFNVGRADEISIRRLAELVVAATGTSSRIVHVSYERAYDEGFEDVRCRVPDASRVRAFAGWRPTHTLREIIQDVIHYERATVAHRLEAPR